MTKVVRVNMLPPEVKFQWESNFQRELGDADGFQAIEVGYHLLVRAFQMFQADGKPGEAGIIEVLTGKGCPWIRPAVALFFAASLARKRQPQAQCTLRLLLYDPESKEIEVVDPEFIESQVKGFMDHKGWSQGEGA